MEKLIRGYVVTHTDSHDDEESLERALDNFASNQHAAWTEFLKLAGGSRALWNKRGYVARRVSFRLEFEE